MCCRPSIDLTKLDGLYKSIALGKDGIVSLIGLDGVIRAAGANGESRADVIGRKLPNAIVLDAVEKSPAGSYWNNPTTRSGTRIDRVSRLIAYRTVENMPLVAVREKGASAAPPFSRAATSGRFSTCR